MLRRAALVAAFVVLALPSGASADGWGPVVDLSVGGLEPQIATDAAGNATAVWQQSHGVDLIVQGRRIATDGSLGPIHDLSAAGASTGPPQVAVDPAGKATIVWSRSNGVNNIVQARQIAADGTVGATRDLSAPGRSAELPQLAADPTGGTTVVWGRSDGTDVIAQARRIAADGTLGPTHDLSAAGGTVFAPDVAVDPTGSAVAVWTRFDGANHIAQTRRIAADGSLGPTRDLSAPGQNAITPHVALDAAGNATALWLRSDGTDLIAQARRIAAGGTLGATHDLSAPGHGAAGTSDVAVGPTGNATAAWSRFDGTAGIVQARRIDADDSVRPTDDLSAPGQSAGEPRVATDPAANVVAVWERRNGTNSIIQARWIAADGSLGATQDLSAPGQDAFASGIATDAGGNAAAIWERTNGTVFVIQSRPYLRSPSCQGTAAATPFQTATTVALRCSGLRLSRQIASGPAHGALGGIDQTAGTVTYTPVSGFSGADQFTFKAVNDGGESGAVTASIDVGAAPPGTAPPVLPPPGVVAITGRASAALFGRTLRFRRGKANERVRCDNVAGDQCTLTATVSSDRGAVARKRRPRPKVLARASTTISGGQTGRLTWRLTRAGRKALRHRRARAALAGSSRNRAGESVRLAGRRTLVVARKRKR